MCDSVEVNLPIIVGSGLKKRFKNVENNEDLVDLLSKILCYSPQKRLKPFEALAHPYFDKLRDRKLTINQRQFVDLFDFNKIEVGN